MKFKPKISIIMPLSKDRGFLSKSIESVLKQSFKDFEFIIILNGFDKKTEAKCEDFARLDNRIKIIKLPKGYNDITLALNIGLNRSLSSIIARIDEGAIWIDEHKLKEQYNFLLKKNLVLLGTLVQICFKDKCKNSYRPSTDKDIRKYFLMGKNPFFHYSVLFRKVLYYNNNLPRSQDYELWLRMSFLGKMENISESYVRKIYANLNSLSLESQSSYLQFYLHKQIYRFFLKSLDDRNIKQNFISGQIKYSLPRRKRNKHLCSILKVGSKLGRLFFNLCNWEVLGFNIEKLMNYLILRKKYSYYLNGDINKLKD